MIDDTPRTHQFLAEHPSGFGMAIFARSLEREVANLQGEANVLADILWDAYEVIKTIEGESTEEEESLWQLRYSIATALAPYRPVPKPTIESGAT